MEHKLSQKEREVDKLHSQVAECEYTIRELKEEKSELVVTKTDLKKKVADNEFDIDELEEQIEELEEKNRELVVTNTDLMTKVADNEQKIEELEEKNSDLDITNTELKMKLKTLREKVGPLNEGSISADTNSSNDNVQSLPCNCMVDASTQDSINVEPESDTQVIPPFPVLVIPMCWQSPEGIMFYRDVMYNPVPAMSSPGFSSQHIPPPPGFENHSHWIHQALSAASHGILYHSDICSEPFCNPDGNTGLDCNCSPGSDIRQPVVSVSKMKLSSNQVLPSSATEQQDTVIAVSTGENEGPLTSNDECDILVDCRLWNLFAQDDPGNTLVSFVWTGEGTMNLTDETLSKDIEEKVTAFSKITQSGKGEDKMCIQDEETECMDHTLHSTLTGIHSRPKLTEKHHPPSQHAETSIHPSLDEIHSKPPDIINESVYSVNRVDPNVDEIHSRPPEASETHLFIGSLHTRPPDDYFKVHSLDLGVTVKEHSVEMTPRTPAHFTRPPEKFEEAEHQVTDGLIETRPTDKDRSLPVKGTVNHRKKIAFMVIRLEARQAE